MLSRLGNSYANVTATLALVVALGGTAYATGLITGTDIKNGSIAAKDLKKDAVNTKKVKNFSLLASDFKEGQLPAGEPGPQGSQGIQGPQGEKGDACLPAIAECVGPKGEKGDPGTNGTTGARGPSNGYSTANPVTDSSKALKLSVPAGNYLVYGKVEVMGPSNPSDGQFAACQLASTPSSLGDLSHAYPYSVLSVHGIAVLSTAGQLRMTCSRGNTNNGVLFQNARLSAIAVETLTE